MNRIYNFYLENGLRVLLDCNAPIHMYIDVITVHGVFML